MSAKNLLVELFVEELPPKALNKLGETFSSVLFETLKSQGLAAENAVVTAYASPRRLAVHATNILTVAPDKTSTQKLMPVSVGFDAAGRATPALIKRLQGMGLDETSVPKLTKQMDGKNEALFLDVMQKGAALKDGLQIALNEAISKLPIPKVMTYQLADGWESVNFVRPAHGLVALHGSEIVAVTALGLTAGNQTQGHRFEAAISPVVLKNADTYAEQLKTEGAVIASFAERRAEIVRQLNATATKQNLKPIEDEALLDEVTALVERPNVLLGQFEEIYLEVPQECLILTMKANQKYFPLLDANGKLTNKFLIVSNISPTDPSAVIQGNERVVRPRLADAKFFFDQDRKKTLESRLEGLHKVVYHNKLGSQGERTERVRAIAKWVAEKIGADPKLADRAALLAKADLLTDMVGEFPELQGIMGSYYAIHDGENTLVADAIADQYLVRRDDLNDASNLVSESLLIADKVETLVGIWAIGLKPTGEKDPFALRRHALGIIKSFELCAATAAICHDEFKLSLSNLLEYTAKTFTSISIQPSIIEEIKDFVFNRYQNQLSIFFKLQTLDAVVTLDPPLHEVYKRAKAVKSFQQLSEADSLAAANKRVGNILKKVEGEVNAEVNANLLQEPAEISLNAALSQVKPVADQLFESGDYTASLKSLAALKAPVDAFFDNVMVNADDPALKANRLGLLATLHQAMNRVADLSKLAS
ncbi:MAG: glycine--tRNA ligase subunit beta [Methylotenera sp.]